MKVWYYRKKDRTPLGCTILIEDKISWSWCDKEDTFRKKTAVEEAKKKLEDIDRFSNVPKALIPQVERMADHFNILIPEVTTGVEKLES